MTFFCSQIFLKTSFQSLLLARWGFLPGLRRRNASVTNKSSSLMWMEPPSSTKSPASYTRIIRGHRRLPLLQTSSFSRKACIKAIHFSTPGIKGRQFHATNFLSGILQQKVGPTSLAQASSVSIGKIWIFSDFPEKLSLQTPRKKVLLTCKPSSLLLLIASAILQRLFWHPNFAP